MLALSFLPTPLTPTSHLVMLDYAGKYCQHGEYCNACQLGVTVIRSSDAAVCDAAVMSCIKWLTMD